MESVLITMKTRQITPDGDEETELMTCCKILGPIVTKVKVNEVSVLPTVGKTSGKSLMASVNALHNVIFLFYRGIDGLILCIFHYSSHHVITKGTVVVQLCF